MASPPPGSRQPSRRPPVDRPNYWVRRVGALVVVVLVGYSLVRVAGSLLGGDASATDERIASADSPDASATTETSTGAAGTGSDDGAAIDCENEADAALCDDLGLESGATLPDGGPIPEGDVETNAVAGADDGSGAGSGVPSGSARTDPPTPSNPAKVYIVGDSDAGTFGPYLEKLLDGTKVATTELNYKVSSGLARPDFFNWPAELAEKLPAVDPDIVIVTFGGNDSQGLRNLDLTWEVNDPLANEAEWTTEYRRRVGEVMDLLLADNRYVIWVGIPNDDNPEVTAKLELQDQAVRAEAATRPGIVFVDSWARFSGRDGGWAEFVVDPRDQEGKDVRADDGFHLNQNGAEILAIDIAIQVQTVLREMGADL